MGRFEGKVAVVAGGATGIGAATAQRLGGEGAAVVVGDINTEGAQSTAERILTDGGKAVAVTFDIADEASVQSLFAAAVEAFGGVDLLFNVAADLRPETIGEDSTVVDMDLAVWDRTQAVNLRGNVLTLRSAIPLMLERGGGAIVNTSSGAAFMGEPQRVAYAAAKAGVNALTRHVASRWGRKGIRCNAVAPGLIVVRPEQAETDLAQIVRKMNPTGRLGTPEDIADMVLFLFSEEASYVNGQILSVDGGTTMR